MSSGVVDRHITLAGGLLVLLRVTSVMESNVLARGASRPIPVDGVATI